MDLIFYLGIVSLVLAIIELVVGRSLALSWDFFPSKEKNPSGYWRDVVAHLILGIGGVVIGLT